jgi:hypothetical protein
MGNQSFTTTQVASNNTAVGASSLTFVNSNGNNTAIGADSMYYNFKGTDNVSLGYQSLKGAYTSGAYSAVTDNFSSSTVVGAYAGHGTTTSAITSGILTNERTRFDSFATLIGWNATRDSSVASTTALTNFGCIGANCKVATSSAFIIGGTGTWANDVGIGTSSPTTRLQVNNQTATSTISATVIDGGTRSTTLGGRIILQDIAGGTCTEITTQTGAIISKAVTCP